MNIENAIQFAVNSLEEGCVARLLRAVLLAAVAVGVFALYSLSQFRGLREAEAMEYAQLARAVHEGRGLATRCLRPLDLRSLPPQALAAGVARGLPDVRHAPAYPVLLAAAFRAARPDFAPPAGMGVFRPETRVILPTGVALCVATALLLFVLGRSLFGPRTALLAAAVFVLCEPVLQAAMSGTPLPLAMFLTTASLCAAAAAVRRAPERGRTRRREAGVLAAVVGAAALAGLAFLTAYALAAVAVAACVVLVSGLERRRAALALVFAVVVVLSAAPWLARNRRIAGSPFGLAPYAALHDAGGGFPEDAVERSFAPDLAVLRVHHALKRKTIEGARRLLASDVPLLGSGIVAAFFLASLFHRFEEPGAARLQWSAALGVAILAVFAAVRGPPATRLMNAFLPLVVLFGTAAFMAAVGRLSRFEGEWEAALSAVYLLLAALPAILTCMAGRAPLPYPPYFPPLAAYASGLAGDDALVCTDIPWATAWYGNRTSLLLPENRDDLVACHRDRCRVGAVYLTSETADRPYLRDLAKGRWNSWLPVLRREVPPDFPWKHAIEIPPGTGDQIVLIGSAPGAEVSPTNAAATPASP